MRRDVFFLLCVYIAGACACGDPGDYSITKLSQVPSVQASDRVQVYFLRAPLLQSRLNSTALGALGLFHSGVGFRSLNQTTWQVELDAVDFNGALFPSVSNDNVTTWDHSTAQVCGLDFIRRTYWDRAALVTTISGVQYAELAATIASYTRSGHTTYQGFAVEQQGQLQHFSSTCTDFTWHIFGKLRSMHVTLNPIVLPASSQITLFANTSVKIQRVNVSSDPFERANVATFYWKQSALYQDLIHHANSSTVRTIGDFYRLVVGLSGYEYYVLAGDDHEVYIKVQLNHTRPVSLLVTDPLKLFDSTCVANMDCQNDGDLKAVCTSGVCKCTSGYSGGGCDAVCSPHSLPQACCRDDADCQQEGDRGAYCKGNGVCRCSPGFQGDYICIKNNAHQKTKVV